MKYIIVSSTKFEALVKQEGVVYPLAVQLVQLN